jgi:hypothetical protein
MSDDLQHAKAAVLVFAMPGCGACHDYLPRLEAMVKHFQTHGIPLMYYANRPVGRGQIPIIICDSTSTNEQVQALLDQHQVDAMPTTVLITHNVRPVKRVGAISDEEIHEILSSAAIAGR